MPQKKNPLRLNKPVLFPVACTLTSAGLSYDNGVGNSILHRPHP